MLRIVSIAVVVIALVVAGCAPQAGVVTAAQPKVGAIAPDVTYVDTQGKTTNFNKVRYPVAVVVFVTPEGSESGWMDPKVAKVADELWDYPVTVAQFCLPKGTCPHGPNSTEMYHLRKAGLMSFCDGGHIAWDAFGEPPVGSMILINRANKIVMTGTLDNPRAVMDEATRLGQAEKDRRETDKPTELY